MRMLDLFSGTGAMALGLQRAGMEISALCEIDTGCRERLADHFPNAHIYENVEDLHCEQGSYDLVAAGWPCTDLSTAGRQDGIDGEQSGLWREVARLLGEIRPSFALLENVPALLAGDYGRWFGRVLGDLAEVGMDAEWDCIPASDCGAPHLRERIWIVAHAMRFGLPGPGRYIQPMYPEKDAYRQADGIVDAVRRNALPYLCRRHDGPASRLDAGRLMALGNALVPQIPEQIGRAIMEAEYG